MATSAKAPTANIIVEDGGTPFWILMATCTRTPRPKTWNVGATYTTHGFGIDVRYVGTDIDASDDLIAQAFTTAARADDRVVISLKRAL